MKKYSSLILVFLLVACSPNPDRAMEQMGLKDEQPAGKTAPEQGPVNPAVSDPAQAAPDTELDCRYEVIKRNFQSDVRYPEIVDAVVAFAEYRDSLSAGDLAATEKEFTRIYVEFARPLRPCSEKYLAMYENTGEVEVYARKMCRQLSLSMYFNEKYPCLKQLSNEEKMGLITEQ